MSALLRQIHDWLETDARALLWAEPPESAIAVGIVLYSLLLIQHGDDPSRTANVVAMIREQSPAIHAEYSFVIAQQMALDEAVVGQLALACCGCVTAIVRDEVINSADPEYLQELHQQMLGSDEFQPVNATILSVPETDAGRRFCWQFLGLAKGLKAPTTKQIFLKTARLMDYCARNIGVELHFNVPS
jgi:hypothetical protein